MPLSQAIDEASEDGWELVTVMPFTMTLETKRKIDIKSKSGYRLTEYMQVHDLLLYFRRPLGAYVPVQQCACQNREETSDVSGQGEGQADSGGE